MNGTWSAIDLGGKQAEVYEMKQGQQPRFGLLYLHSYARESLRGKSAFTRQLDDQRMVCICPSGGHGWWGDRLCPSFDPTISPEQYLLNEVMPEFRNRFGFESKKVGLLGISMGGQGALRLACKYPGQWAATAAISSVIDYHELHGLGSPLDELYDSKESCRQDTAAMHIRQGRKPENLFFCCDPEDTNWYRGNDRFHDKLNAMGIPHECDLTTRGGGHTWEYFDLMAPRAISFLASSLERESRRLL